MEQIIKIELNVCIKQNILLWHNAVIDINKLFYENLNLLFETKLLSIISQKNFTITF